MFDLNLIKYENSGPVRVDCYHSLFLLVIHFSSRWKRKTSYLTEHEKGGACRKVKRFRPSNENILKWARFPEDPSTGMGKRGE